MKNIFLIGLYLGAIIAANLIVAEFGPSATVICAFLFIGLDLTGRDKLHNVWQRNGLFWKMGLLISCGTIISWIFNQNAGKIAIASFVAFAIAAIADTIVYHLLKERAYLVKINGSNIISAALDSLIFPTLAFGGIMPLITLGQFIAKISGGFIWALILRHAETINILWQNKEKQS